MGLIDEKLEYYRRKREVAKHQLQYINGKILELELFKERIVK